MKYLVVLATWLLARVGMAVALPADTLKGQAHFVRHLSSSMCAHLSTELQGKEVSQLTADECDAVLNKLTYQAMADNSDEFQGLSKQNSGSTSDLGKQVGLQAVLSLVQTCPAGNALLLRMSMLRSGLDKGIDPAERTLLQPIVQAACQRLETIYTTQPTGQRGQLFQTELRSAILTQRAELTAYYGEDVLGDNKKAEQVGQKIGLLMLGECPRYLLLATQDGLAAKKNTSAPAQPVAKPKRPASKTTKPPVRHATGR